MATALVGYEPPCVANGSVGEWEVPLAPGVLGYAVEHQGAIYIPFLVAETEGAGQVGRFLDSLSGRCRIPNVISSRLEGMLERRGWARTLEQDPADGGTVDVWVHPEAVAP